MVQRWDHVVICLINFKTKFVNPQLHTTLGGIQKLKKPSTPKKDNLSKKWMCLYEL